MQNVDFPIDHSDDIKEWTEDFDLDRLEEFAKNLLDEITNEFECSPTEREDLSNDLQKNSSTKMVGSSSKQLESSEHASLDLNPNLTHNLTQPNLSLNILTQEEPKICIPKPKPKSEPIQIENTNIQYIPEIKSNQIKILPKRENILRKTTPKITRTKNLETRIKINTTSSIIKPKIEHSEAQKSLENNLGSYEANLRNSQKIALHSTDYFKNEDDCITIIVSDESEIPISEAIQEIESSEIMNDQYTNLKDFVSNYTVVEDVENDLKSNIKTEKALSDYGYESTGSPHSEICENDYSENSEIEMSELWNQSVTELFPTLM